jgi:hypothetical protein
MCKKDPDQVYAWCEKHCAEMVIDMGKGHERRRCEDRFKYPFTIWEVDALHDTWHPFTTVTIHFAPRSHAARSERRPARALFSSLTFSITTRVRHGTNVPGGHWVSVRMNVAEECKRLGYGFARACKWNETDTEGTRLVCTVGQWPHPLADRKYPDIRDKHLPKHGRRARLLAGLIPWTGDGPMLREPPDVTPLRWRPEVVCGQCDLTMSKHLSTASQKHEDFVYWKAGLEKWRIWYASMNFTDDDDTIGVHEPYFPSEDDVTMGDVDVDVEEEASI